MKQLVKKVLLQFPIVRDYIGFKKSLINRVPFRNYLEYKLFGSQGGGERYILASASK